MRKQQQTLIITFYTTTQAIHMEKICKEYEIPARMIPVPRNLSAGCGHALALEPNYRENVEEMIVKEDIEYEEITEIMF